MVFRLASVASETPLLQAAPPIVMVPVAGQAMIFTVASVSPVSTSE